MKPEHIEFHENYMIRKNLRVELARRRVADKDHSVERYKADAAWLNKALQALQIFDQPIARWGK